jgi:TM2 domain-containing membrane protein YozV
MSQYPNYDPNQQSPAPTSGGYSYPTSGAPDYQQQAGYQQQPAYQQPAYGQQVAYDPQGRPYSDKSKMTAGLLGIFLGGFGVGRFYTGHTGLAVGQLLVTLFTCGIGSLWGFIDGIMLLVNGGTDAQGRVLRD